MEHRKLGSLNVSVAGVGCNNFGWRIGAAETAAVVDAALDAGINFFDTADVYGGGQSEEFLGKALRGRRDQAVVATKFGIRMGEGLEGASAKYIPKALDASLRRLGVDVIDLYQLHRPDPATPIVETLAALNEAVKAGKVREIGCSNFSETQIREARETDVPVNFVTVQNEYSLLNRDPESAVLPACVELGMGMLPYFPLANGLLSGKYRRGAVFPEASRAKDGFGPKVFTPENLEVVERLIAFAQSRNRTLLELSMSWLAVQRGVTSVIAGAKTPDQARANAAAVNWRLSHEDLREVEAALSGSS